MEHWDSRRGGATVEVGVPGVGVGDLEGGGQQRAAKHLLHRGGVQRVQASSYDPESPLPAPKRAAQRIFSNISGNLPLYPEPWNRTPPSGGSTSDRPKGAC